MSNPTFSALTEFTNSALAELFPVITVLGSHQLVTLDILNDGGNLNASGEMNFVVKFELFSELDGLTRATLKVINTEHGTDWCVMYRNEIISSHPRAEYAVTSAIRGGSPVGYSFKMISDMQDINQ